MLGATGIEVWTSKKKRKKKGKMVNLESETGNESGEKLIKFCRKNDNATCERKTRIISIVSLQRNDDDV